MWPIHNRKILEPDEAKCLANCDEPEQFHKYCPAAFFYSRRWLQISSWTCRLHYLLGQEWNGVFVLFLVEETLYSMHNLLCYSYAVQGYISKVMDRSHFMSFCKMCGPCLFCSRERCATPSSPTTRKCRGLNSVSSSTPSISTVRQKVVSFSQS